jgi:hypothetical protein
MTRANFLPLTVAFDTSGLDEASELHEASEPDKTWYAAARNCLPDHA